MTALLAPNDYIMDLPEVDENMELASDLDAQGPSVDGDIDIMRDASAEPDRDLMVDDDENFNLIRGGHSKLEVIQDDDMLDDHSTDNADHMHQEEYSGYQQYPNPSEGHDIQFADDHEVDAHPNAPEITLDDDLDDFEEIAENDATFADDNSITSANIDQPAITEYQQNMQEQAVENLENVASKDVEPHQTNIEFTSLVPNEHVDGSSQDERTTDSADNVETPKATNDQGSAYESVSQPIESRDLSKEEEHIVTQPSEDRFQQVVPAVPHAGSSEALGDDNHAEDNGESDSPYANLHPVKVFYEDSELSLFPPSSNDASETYLLQDELLASQTLDKLLGACRGILAGDIDETDELVLDVDALDLHYYEV